MADVDTPSLNRNEENAMALNVSQQLRYWSVATVVFLAVLWVLGDVIMPFVLAGAVAYCLDPLADRLERMGLSRALSVTLISLFAVALFVLFFLLVVPTLKEQIEQFIATAPELFQRLQASLTARFPDLMDADSTIRQQLQSLGQAIQARGGELAQTVFASALGIVNVVVLLVVVPVVGFYLLLDWDRMVAQIDDMLPRDHAPAIREIFKDINDTLASFIRGQGTVCLILGVFYSVALMLVGLNFGIVIGAIAGILTFIPYVGALVGGGLAIGMALFQFWGEWWWIVAVGVIFQVGQFVEGNILTPKLVGSSVGLHPVWLIFALSVFGSLFGFVGLLVAVPVAAMLGVVIRRGIRSYKSSLLYTGSGGAE
jgi:predicted PurR-regulated permease PerM